MTQTPNDSKYLSESSRRRSFNELETSDSLLSRARRFDQRAWVRLVNIYSPLIDYWIRQRGIRGHDLENIRQEVFVRLSKSIGNFTKSNSGGGSFRGYLRTITQNLIFSLYRKGEVNAIGGSAGWMVMNQIPGEEDSFSSLFDSISEEWAGVHRGGYSVENGILFRRIMDWIYGNCSQKQSDVFTRVVLENKRPRDVARDLNMSVGSVYQTKSRILSCIREEFSDLV